MSKLKITGETALKKFNEKLKALFATKADKTELHVHSNKVTLDTITQEMLDGFATHEDSGTSSEITVGPGIEIQGSCSRGLVGCVDYGTKKYGRIQGGSFFFLPNLPLLYLDQNVESSTDQIMLYSQKLISIQDTGFYDESDLIVLEKGKVIYLKGNLGVSKRIFTLGTSDILIQDEPSLADGFDYILLGQAVASDQLILFPHHPIFRYSDGCFSEIGLKTMGVISGQNYPSIASASFAPNTDEYVTYYPYCYDLYDGRISADCWTEVNYTPETLALDCMSTQIRSMDGFIRLYANELPKQSITFDNIVFKEVE